MFRANRSPKAQLVTILERCMASIPGDEQDTKKEPAAYAQDAAASVAYTIRARLEDDPQEAAWAARRAYEAVDYFIVSQIDSTTVTPEDKRFVLSHPLVQAELRRQQADLEELQSVSAEKSLWASVTSKLRDRARRDAEFFLSTASPH